MVRGSLEEEEEEEEDEQQQQQQQQQEIWYILHTMHKEHDML